MKTSFTYAERLARIAQMRELNNDTTQGRRLWGSHVLAGMIERAGFPSNNYIGDSRIINRLEASSIIDALEEHLNLEMMQEVHR